MEDWQNEGINCMERLQELIQRTETIQKVNALQQNVAKQLFTYPILGKKEKTKRRIRKYLLFQQIPPVDRFYWPNALLAQRTVGSLQRYLRQCEY